MIASIDQEDTSPVTTHLARWLFENQGARAILDAELGLFPAGIAPRYGVPLAKLTGLPPLAGKVDVLLCEPHAPAAATVVEVKCLLVSAALPGASLRLPAAELAMTIRHMNRLAEIGFSQLWLLLCLMLDDVNPAASDAERLRAWAALLSGVDEGPTLRLLHPSVGFGFLVVSLVPGPEPARTLGALVRRRPTPMVQKPRVTAMVARVFRLSGV
jgi:hypothetical protein